MGARFQNIVILGKNTNPLQSEINMFTIRDVWRLSYGGVRTIFAPVGAPTLNNLLLMQEAGEIINTSGYLV